MLNTSSPKAPHIVSASIQLDLILGRCRRITVAYAPSRRFVAETIRPSFAALRWLNENRFENSAEIADAVAQFEKRVDDLADFATTGERPVARLPDKCPVCGLGIADPVRDEPFLGCPDCMESVMDRYRRLDRGFGSWAI
jgi:hypothetical protein